jgi:hypothetical protein
MVAVLIFKHFTFLWLLGPWGLFFLVVLNFSFGIFSWGFVILTSFVLSLLIFTLGGFFWRSFFGGATSGSGDGCWGWTFFLAGFYVGFVLLLHLFDLFFDVGLFS